MAFAGRSETSDRFARIQAWHSHQGIRSAGKLASALFALGYGTNYGTRIARWIRTALMLRTSHRRILQSRRKQLRDAQMSERIDSQRRYGAASTTPSAVCKMKSYSCAALWFHPAGKPDSASR